MQNDRLIEIARSLVGDILSRLCLWTSLVRVPYLITNQRGRTNFCAEHAAVAEMLKHRETEIAKIVAVTEKKILPPCGRCRELMLLTNPANSKTQVIVSEDRTVKLANLLPHHWLES